MRRTVLVSLIGLTATALLAAADAPSAADAIATRKAAFNLSAATFSAANAMAASSEPDWRALGFSASAIARWAHALPGAFPAGTSAGDLPGQTTASPAIWTDNAGFRAKADAYAVAAERLSELAAAQDLNGYKAQLGVVRQTCAACHDVYRVQPAR